MFEESAAAYVVKHNKKHGGFFAAVINANESAVDLFALEPASRTLMLLTKNPSPAAEDLSDQYLITDACVVSSEFVTAVRDQSEDGLRVKSRIAVEEMGFSVLNDQDVPVHWVDTMILERCPIAGFEFKKRGDNGLYYYSATLANGWAFNLVAFSERSPDQMELTGFNESAVCIDGVIYKLFPEATNHRQLEKTQGQTFVSKFDIYCVGTRFLDLDAFEQDQIKHQIISSSSF